MSENYIFKEISFPSKDGVHTIYAEIYIPKMTPVGVVQLSHGMIDYVGRYKELADFDVDTFFAYELPVYKTVLLQLCPEFDECVKRARHSGELSRFVDACSALPVDVVPEDSLIKEFIG